MTTPFTVASQRLGYAPKVAPPETFGNAIGHFLDNIFAIHQN
ncbi:MAG TPA: hypothetical protein VF299_03940 [Mycobacterium sp.]